MKSQRDKVLELRQSMRRLEALRAAHMGRTPVNWGAIIQIDRRLRLKGHRLNRLKRQAGEELRERRNRPRTKHRPTPV